MSFKDKRLAELRASVKEIAPGEAHRLHREGAVLVDIREPDEVAQGAPEGAQRIVRGFLELRIEDAAPDPDTPVLVLCAGGVRSLFAAEDLQRMGYTDVRSVAGGFNAWKTEGLPIEVPRTLNDSQRERYARHLLMPEVGEEGQTKLLDAKVLLLGAGGLGSPAALYLAAAGVGTLGIVDDDIVDRSNLQRQLLHRDTTVGTPKVESAAKTIGELNPDVNVVAHPVRIDSSNVEEIFSGYDVVVDGSDNFPTRYLVNDACVKLGIPNVHGSIFRFDGQVSVFYPGWTGDDRETPCYRCMFPAPPPPELAPSCAEAGVLGVLPGVVGTLQAIETIKLILGIGDPLIGKLLTYDALDQEFRILEIPADPSCICAPGAEFPGYVDYVQFCAVGAGA